MAIDLERMVREFSDYSIDPATTNKAEFYANLSLIKNTLDLSSPAAIKIANSLIASLLQVIWFKLATAKYWVTILETELDQTRSAVAVVAHREHGDFNKNQIDALVGSTQGVVDLGKRLANALASVEFWKAIQQMLQEVADRVDGNAKTIAVESNLSSNTIRS